MRKINKKMAKNLSRSPHHPPTQQNTVTKKRIFGHIHIDDSTDRWQICYHPYNIHYNYFYIQHIETSNSIHLHTILIVSTYIRPYHAYRTLSSRKKTT